MLEHAHNSRGHAIRREIVFEQNIEERISDPCGIATARRQRLVATQETVRVHTHADGNDKDTASNAVADLLVGPEALVEVRCKEGNERVARVERRLDLVLPLSGRLDVLVRYECVDGLGGKIGLITPA